MFRKISSLCFGDRPEPGGTPACNHATTETEIPWAWVKAVRYLIDNPIPPIKPVPVEIVPWLFLSDEYAVRDGVKLRELGVTHVLSVNKMSDNERMLEQLRQRFHSAGIVHKYCPGEDEEGYDMLGLHWEECRGFLQNVRDSGGIAVVHCSAGINRSGLIVAAAYMTLDRKPVLDVVQRCVQQRGMVLWNRSFQQQLCVLAAKEGLLGEKPEGYSDEPIGEVLFQPPPLGIGPSTL